MPSLAWRASHGGCCAFAGPSVFGARTSARGCMNSGAVSQARNRFRIDGSPSRSRRAGYRCWRYESASLRIPASSACGSEPCLRSSLLRQPFLTLRYRQKNPRCSTASFRGSRGTIASREADTYRTQMSDGHRPMRSRFTASSILSV